MAKGKEPRPTKRARAALTEKRAWEIAITAGKALEGRVRLVAATREPELTGSFEWVEIGVPLPEQKPSPSLQTTLNWVLQARNACVVWHMLACCRGFQGHENAEFWKRVIDHVGRDRNEVTMFNFDPENFDEEEDDRQFWGSSEPVSDAHKFFPTWCETKTTFPRFRLHVPYSKYFDEYDGYEIDDDDLDIETADDWIKNVVRTFVGMSNGFESDMIKRYKAQLFDFIDFKRYAKSPVEIGVHVGASYKLEDVADMLSGLIADIETDALARKEEKFLWRLLGHSRFPLAKFTELSMCDRQAIANEDSLNDVTEILRTCNVVIPEVAIAPNAEYMGEEALTDFMFATSLFRREGAGRVESLVLHLHDAEEWQIALLFSAIPITGVRKLQVFGLERDYRDQGVTMNRHAWTWLAYAVYHPWLSHSYVDLDLQFLDVTEPTARPMQGGLAAQRQLYRLLHGERDETLPAEDDFDWPLGRYAIAKVRKGARCFEDESLDGDQLCKFNSDIDVTAVIKFNTLNLEELPDAVCVVVAGRGVGWVAKKYVTSLTRPYADYAQIQGLRLGRNRADPAMALSTLHPLVHHLTSLDMSAWGKFSSDKLLDVLRECYMLKNLRVEHAGELFHEWEEDTPAVDEDGLLWELELTSLHLVCYDQDRSFVPPSQAAWDGVLHKLSELSVQTCGGRRRHLQAVQTLFQQAYPVQRFLWKTGAWDSLGLPYTTRKQTSQQMLGISKGKFDKAQYAFSAAAKRAFASVIKRKAVENEARDARGLRSRKGTGSVLGQLSPDVARLICDFATTDSDRVVWVDDR